MPGFLHFYRGAVTRDEYWRLPGREYRAMFAFMDKTLKEQAGR